MTQAKQIFPPLGQRAYRSLKPTPDLAFHPSIPVSQEKQAEDQLILEYEERLQAQKSKRGY